MLIFIVRILRQIVANVRNFFYDLHINNTPRIYKYVLENNHIKDNTSILEVGIGNGTCIKKNARLIKNKNLHIDGIDIDEDYIQKCNEVIIENNLDKNVTVRYENLFDLDEKKKYNYIFFTESYPVIPEEIMIDMMKKSKNLLKPGGKVIFIHNLEKTHTFIRDYLKPKLKYVPFLWVDFGRLSTHNDFDKFLKDTDFTIYEKILIEKIDIKSHYNNLLAYFVPEFLNLKCSQYFISCILK